VVTENLAQGRVAVGREVKNFTPTNPNTSSTQPEIFTIGEK
jgi:hypothetical protein